MPTPAEQTAYAHMQARLIALMLQHDQHGFRRFIDARVDAAEADQSATRPYRDLGVLFFLGAALFEDILPRIVRRLSFESPRSTVVEEPPARGRVQWERTLDAVWAERPGEPPLLLHTRQRRRDFATAENLLTVVTLLEYEASIRNVLHGDHMLIGAQALRHPLNDLAERCRRELAFPQFAGLLPQARRAIDGAGGGVAALEARVAAHAAPGGNRAYQELLAWRVRWRALQLLRRAPDEATHDVLGADPERDNYLYQLWIFYELADMLHHENKLVAIDTQAGRMALRFTWDANTYELRHDQSVPKPVSRWSAQPNPKDVPGVRPDFYLRRIDPPPAEVSDGQTQIWREPGVVWDAKYYRERESERTPSLPVKRMIADLALLGESYGVLLFAFHSGTSGANEIAEGDTFSPQRLSPTMGIDQTLTPQEVAIQQLRPVLNADRAGLQHLLRSLLHDLHARIGQPRTPACHGIFLDTLSANAAGVLADITGLTTRTGAAFNTTLDDLLVCPKPHIGAWRVDLVSLTHDCCANSALCHIKGLAGARKPQRLTALDEIASALQQLDPAGDDEALVSAAQQQALVITRRYAQLLQPNIASYKRWIRDRLAIDDLFETTTLLSDQQRETLALARFLWEQIEHIRASNFAGPMLLFSGVLEEIARATIYSVCPNLYDNRGLRLMQSLGVLGKSKGYGGNNWRILERDIAHGGRWNEQVTVHQHYPFSRWIDAIGTIADIRNKAAHEARADLGAFATLIELYFGNARTGVGVLNGILLAWYS
jgi:hypothetical protein